MKITLEEFTSQVMDDFRLAVNVSGIYRDKANGQSYNDLADCALAQVVLSRYSCERYMPAATDIAPAIRANAYSGTCVTFSTSDAINNASNGQSVVCSVMGNAFDTIYEAASKRLPLALVIWNKVSGNMPNSDMGKLLSGFSSVFRNELNIQVVKGNDYPAMCITMEKQLAFTHSRRLPSVTIVECSSNALENFSQWIIDRKLSTPEEIKAIRTLKFSSEPHQAL